MNEEQMYDELEKLRDDMDSAFRTMRKRESVYREVQSEYAAKLLKDWHGLEKGDVIVVGKVVGHRSTSRKQKTRWLIVGIRARPRLLGDDSKGLAVHMDLTQVNTQGTYGHGSAGWSQVAHKVSVFEKDEKLSQNTIQRK